MYISINPKWSEKEKRWRVDLMRDGVRKTFSSSIPRSEGKRIVREKALEWIENGGNNKSVTLETAFDLFAKDYKTKHGENTQLTRINSVGKCHILPKLGKYKVGQITLDQWQGVITGARPVVRRKPDGSEKKRPTQLSKKSLKNIREVVVLFMRWALPRDYMSTDFTSELYIPHGAPTKGKEILQISEIERWFQNPTGLWFERALMFELLTGLRPGEVLGLKKEDYKNGIITIRRSINAQGKITTGKNENARRRMELVGEVRELLEEQLNETADLKSDWIFCSPFGMMPSQWAYTKCFTRIKEKMGFSPSLSPYCLRHTFYTQVESYLPSRLIKTIFGHSEATDGHALYGAHELDGELHEAADRLKVTPLYSIRRKAMV